jgi:hypothetical protein
VDDPNRIGALDQILAVRARRPNTLLGLSQFIKEHAMGKYFLGWILGVPAIVLVAIYIFMH